MFSPWMLTGPYTVFDLETTGMSEGLYNGLMIAIATIATVGTLASSFSYSFKNPLNNKK